MTFTRRSLVFVSMLAVAVPALPALASDYPHKPIRLVVPYSPGGPTDAMARTLATALTTVLGQRIIVDNRAGASANLGAEIVARAEPDGYTLMFGTSAPLAVNISLFRKLNYDPVKNFTPVYQLGHLPNVLTVHPGVPVKNVNELISYAKAHPGTMTFASSGNGATSHLAGVLFNQAAGTDFLHVPYKGTGPAVIDLLGGLVSMTFTDVLTAQPHIKAGKLRPLGVTTFARSQALPDVPTMAEQGLADFDVSVFFAIVGPAGMPRNAVTKLNNSFVKVLGQSEVRQFLQKQGLEFAAHTSPEALDRFIRSEIAKWRKIVKSSGTQVD